MHNHLPRGQRVGCENLICCNLQLPTTTMATEKLCGKYARHKTVAGHLYE